MKHWLEPDWDSKLNIINIPHDHFLKRNIKVLILDVDKTILEGKDIVVTNKVKDWVSQAKLEMKLHLLSNNPSQQRIKSVASQLDLTYTYAAAKPRKRAILKVIEELKTDPSRIAIIGDRIFTDILAGNRIGLYTVLVQPITSHGDSIKNNYFQKIEQNLARFLGARNK